MLVPVRIADEKPRRTRRSQRDTEQVVLSPCYSVRSVISVAKSPLERSAFMPGQRGELGATPTGVTRPQEALRVLEHVETRHIRFINLEFTDVVGLVKCVTIPADQFADCLAH